MLKSSKVEDMLGRTVYIRHMHTKRRLSGVSWRIVAIDRVMNRITLESVQTLRHSPSKLDTFLLDVKRGDVEMQ